MIPYSKTVTIKKGDGWKLVVRVRSRTFNSTTQEWEPGPYRDLTGWDVQAQIRDEFSSTDAIDLVCTIDDQVATTGQITIKLLPAQTDNLVVPDNGVWEGVWDVVLVDTSGDERTYIAGKFKVKPRSTHVS